MATQSNNSFDFNAFYATTANKPAGLQLFLAIKLVENALWTMERYDNPRSEEMRECMSGLKLLRAGMKQDAEIRSRDRAE